VGFHDISIEIPQTPHVRIISSNLPILKNVPLPIQDFRRFAADALAFAKLLFSFRTMGSLVQENISLRSLLRSIIILRQDS
jgi:hypothetical protein